jgi:signal transduction histidine kinase
MARERVVSRRLLIASVALGLFVLFDLALFGWLIFRSLSQREIEKVLLETRVEAETLAAQIAGSAERRGGDLYTAFASERETLTFIDALFRERGLVREVEIRNPDGVLVYREQSQQAMAVDPERGLVPESFEIDQRGDVQTLTETREESFELPDIEVPIGELGTLAIGISRRQLSERITLLRRELTRQAQVIGAVTVATLLAAYLIIFSLFRRGRLLEEQAAEAERMAYIGTLASGLAHEIRNPLNSLNLNMQMIEEELEQAGSERSTGRLMSITRAELSRLERLVTDFLAYARPRPVEIEQVPARELLERTRGVLAGELRQRRAEIEVEDGTGGAALAVDPAQIGQLLLNLVHNALEACEGSGRPARVLLAARRQGAAAVLEVADNGVGIPAEQLDRVFDLFYSTRKGGTGLGLAIVRRIAQNHDGDLEVESRLGEGTTISVTLPGAVVEPGTARQPVPVGRPAIG